MRRKPVPPVPDSLDRVNEAHRGVPLIPGTENDCCSRIADRLDISRDDGRDWLVFCQSLGLARETSRGFERMRDEKSTAELRTAFVEHVFGAREVIDALGTEPQSADDVFALFEPSVPRWERHRDPNGWETRWRTRVERLLGWAVLFGFAKRDDDKYVAKSA